MECDAVITSTPPPAPAVSSKSSVVLNVAVLPQVYCSNFMSGVQGAEGHSKPHATQRESSLCNTRFATESTPFHKGHKWCIHVEAHSSDGLPRLVLSVFVHVHVIRGGSKSIENTVVHVFEPRTRSHHFGIDYRPGGCTAVPLSLHPFIPSTAC